MCPIKLINQVRLSPILQKVERGKAAAAPAQRHNIKNFFDPTKAAARAPPKVISLFFL